jgi:hypothetical protein
MDLGLFIIFICYCLTLDKIIIVVVSDYVGCDHRGGGVEYPWVVLP